MGQQLCYPYTNPRKGLNRMGLFLKLVAAMLTSPPKSQKSKREREFDAYGLTEEEKRIARKEGYDPWDFEEDEMDEDGYYSDDT